VASRPRPAGEAFLIGTQLGPYEITAKLGEGGMGEVYRAKDTKLHRDVAIKVLPVGFTEDKDRLARFEREAQLLAQLHHPNIASIFGMEDSGETKALVMELVEGPTLADRLEQGSLSIEESLSIARQIAEALEAAHEKGIVHRDLKPQNIKASVEGQVKVLDFGLAKAMDPVGGASGSASQLAASPTLTLGATVQGVILGTAAYMAPEQAAGGVADRRADVWSFGVVLYEMLAGRRLFEGETVSHVLAGVLKDEPDFSALPEDTPPRIRRLLTRCLRKKPRERLHSVADARIVIDEVLAGPEDEARPAERMNSSPRRTLGPAALGLAALTLVLGLVAGARFLATRAEPPAPIRVELALPAPLELGTQAGHVAISLSPDGRRIVAAIRDEDERTRLAVRDLGELEARILEDTEDAQNPVFSPDGEWIAFFGPTSVRKIAFTGGRSIRIAEVDLTTMRGGAWGRDGYIYFSPTFASGIVRVSEAGGPVEAVTELDEARGERTHRFPTFTPDGRALVYTSDDAATPAFYDDSRIEALDLATRTRHVLVEGARQARFVADDVIAYSKEGNLFVARFDAARLEVTGKPVALEQDVRSNIQSGNTQFSIADDGSAIWSRGSEEEQRVTPLWYGLDGTEGGRLFPGDEAADAIDLSPDGRRIAYLTSGRGARSDRGDLWVVDLATGTPLRLTFDEHAGWPTWSPDGRRVAYQRPVDLELPEEEKEIVWRPADGDGEAELLVRCGGFCDPATFSPDGRWLVYHLFGSTTRGIGLWRVPVGRPEEASAWLDGPESESAAAISPDGRWIAYQSLGAVDPFVFVRPYPDGAGQWQVGQGGAPRWSRDGREIFFQGQRAMQRVKVAPGESFSFGRVERLFDLRVRAGHPRNFAFDPSQRRMAVLRSEDATTETSSKLRVLAYSTEWRTRAERLLGRQR